MLRAIIFDLDGVIVDSEPSHFTAFQAVLAEQEISLTEGTYYERYVGLDDAGCFQAVLEAAGRATPPEIIQDLIEQKAVLFAKAIRDHLAPFPGVVEWIRRAAAAYPLAVASGALRREIEAILKRLGVREAFSAIVSAEDVTAGKPSPACYIKALFALNNRHGRGVDELYAQECLAIEDTVAGLQAARRAGMKCLAVANTHPVAELSPHADAVTESLAGFSLDTLNALFKEA